MSCFNSFLLFSSQLKEDVRTDDKPVVGAIGSSEDQTQKENVTAVDGRFVSLFVFYIQNHLN